MSTGSTRESRKLRAQVLREEPLCHLRLPGCTWRSDTLDHIIPISVAPHLKMERYNCRGACASCNYRRGNRPINQLAQMRCEPKQSGKRLDGNANQTKSVAPHRIPTQTISRRTGLLQHQQTHMTRGTRSPTGIAPGQMCGRRDGVRQTICNS